MRRGRGRPRNQGADTQRGRRSWRSLRLNQIGGEGCGKLAAALAVNTVLRDVTYALRDRRPPSHRAQGDHLCATVRYCARCERRLGRNAIGDTGCCALARALAANTVLRALLYVAAAAALS